VSNDFLILVLVYEGRGPGPSLSISSYHVVFMVSVFVIAELAICVGGAKIWNQISALAWISIFYIWIDRSED